MPMVQLDSENADLDLKTALITVLTHTPDASNPTECIGLILLGDGAKNLDGTGGTFELVVTVGGQTIQPSPQEIEFGTEVRSAVWTTPFPVPANAAVILRILSPNAADADVDVTAYLYDIHPLTVASGVGEANTAQISGDSTAADNLEATYDGTGYADDDAPATQAALGNLTSGTAAINVRASSFTKAGAEPETNTYASTVALDGTFHIVEDDATSTDCYYQFNVGGNGVPVSITWWGYVQSQGDSYTLWAYNYGTTTYEQLGALSGSNGTTVSQETFDLDNAHVGTGANAGLVRFRFLSADGTAFATDRILCSYAIVFQSVGYAEGAIWVDTNASNTNTTIYVDGIADNPVSTWAAALTISAALGITRFHIINGSTITLSANSDGYTLLGQAWTLALNGQSFSAGYVEGASVSGTCTGATAPEFFNCHFGNATLPPFHMTWCGLGGTVTLGSAGTAYFDRCHSSVAGTSTPTFDFGGALNSSNVNMRGYSGGIEIENMGAGTGSYNMSLEGHGQLIINANCSATSLIAIRGHFTVTDNAGGAVTLSDNARYDVQQINDEADQALTDWGKTGFSLANASIVAATFGAGAINAAAIANAAIDNATFAADVGSTAYATNIIALATRKALDDYNPPTHAEVTAAFTEIKGAGWAGATDTLEEIRNAVDAVVAGGDATAANQILIRADIATMQVDVTAILDDTGTSGVLVSGAIQTLDDLDTALDVAHGAGAWTTGVGGAIVQLDAQSDLIVARGS